MKFFYLLLPAISLIGCIKGMDHDPDDGEHKVVFQLAPSTHHQTVAISHSAHKETIEIIDNSPDLEAGTTGPHNAPNTNSLSIRMKKLKLNTIDPDLLYDESATQCLMLLHGSKHEKVSFAHKRLKEKLKQAHSDESSPHNQVIEKLIVHTSRKSARIKHEISHQPVALTQTPVNQPAPAPAKASSPAPTHVAFSLPATVTTQASTSVTPSQTPAVPATPNNSPSQSTIIPIQQSASSIVAPAAVSASTTVQSQPTTLSTVEEIGEITLQDLTQLGELAAEVFAEYNSLKTKGLIGTGSLSTVLAVGLAILGALGKSYK